MSAQPPAVPEAQPSTSVCPRCGAGFRCGMVAGDAACWCAGLPLLAELPVRLPNTAGKAKKEAVVASCFCQACLKSLIAATETQSPP